VNRLVEALDQACPGVEADADAIRLGLAYVWMGDFVRHLTRARLAGREAEVRAVFAIIEQTVEEPRTGGALSEQANLAVTGFLEDLQNGGLHAEGSQPSDFQPYLGPKSLRAWSSLNGFWEMVSGTRPV